MSGSKAHLMRSLVASRIMPRTTLDLDATVLAQLKQRGRAERKSLGQVASELLAVSLDDTAPPEKPRPLRWISQPLHPRVDLDDKEAVWAILDRDLDL